MDTRGTIKINQDGSGSFRRLERCGSGEERGIEIPPGFGLGEPSPFKRMAANAAIQFAGIPRDGQPHKAGVNNCVTGKKGTLLLLHSIEP
jgi:hypothetical protein